jgi:hypothetical protein
MQFQSFRSAVVFASVMVASITASQAIAQTPIDVLTVRGGSIGANLTLVSTYKFNQSMILDSIGFLSDNKALTTISYTIGSALPTSLLESQLEAVDANGFRWYTLPNGGLSVNALAQLKVTTRGESIPGDKVDTFRRSVGSKNSSSNVTLNSFSNFGTIATNSNLRVSSPTTNVAPEPGTFALALTGGAALLGICIRRRRNAA